MFHHYYCDKSIETNKYVHNKKFHRILKNYNQAKKFSKLKVGCEKGGGKGDGERENRSQFHFITKKFFFVFCFLVSSPKA